MAIESPRRSFLRTDILAGGLAAALVCMTVTFGAQSSLVVSVEPDGSLSYAESYNSDDDLCVLLAGALFGGYLVLFGWWPSPRFSVLYVKLSVLTLLWLFQLYFLFAWTEQASVALTVTAGRDPVFVVWLTVLLGRAPACWWSAARERTAHRLKLSTVPQEGNCSPSIRLRDLTSGKGSPAKPGRF